MATTTLSGLINPEVMADMISGKLENKIVVTPFATIDTTLEGVPGNTITVPQYNYIGDAEDLAEGAASEAAQLTASSTKVTVKKAVKTVEITDEAKLSGYGDPEGEAASQLAKAIAAKVDADAMAAITGSDVQLKYAGAKTISYEEIVNAIDLFAEEMNTEKVIFVNPAQVTQLRKDANFLSADKYGTGISVMVTGEIGMVANCHVVPSKRIVKGESGYACPIIKLQGDPDTEDETAAVTIYLKRGVNVETARDVTRKVDVYSADEHYAAAVSNTGKVCLATFKA
jgi:N4-gp56 family major capsid protein